MAPETPPATIALPACCAPPERPRRASALRAKRCELFGFRGGPIFFQGDLGAGARGRRGWVGARAPSACSPSAPSRSYAPRRHRERRRTSSARGLASRAMKLCDGFVDTRLSIGARLSRSLALDDGLLIPSSASFMRLRGRMAMFDVARNRSNRRHGEASFSAAPTLAWCEARARLILTRTTGTRHRTPERAPSQKCCGLIL